MISFRDFRPAPGQETRSCRSAVVNAIESAPADAGGGVAAATAAVEGASSTWARALSLATVEPRTRRTAAITPSLLAMIGRALSRSENETSIRRTPAHSAERREYPYSQGNLRNCSPQTSVPVLPVPSRIVGHAWYAGTGEIPDGRTTQSQADRSVATGAARRRRNALSRRRARRPESPLGAAVDHQREAARPRARWVPVRRTRRGARRSLRQPSVGAPWRGPDRDGAAVEAPRRSARRASESRRGRRGRAPERRTGGALWSGTAGRSWTGASTRSAGRT